MIAHDLTSRPGELPGLPGPEAEALSSGERSLWFLHHLAPGDGVYNIAAAARVRSPLTAAGVAGAFQGLVDRHAALRTSFPAAAGEPRRRVAESLHLVLTREDASGWSEERLRSRLAEEAWRPFDIERGPLLRVSLLEGAPGGTVLLLVIHHIVADFWSLAILVRELPALYREASGAGPARLPAPGSYEVQIRMEREAVSGGSGGSGGRGEALLAWWRERLAGLPVLELTTDRPRPAVQTYHGDGCRLRLPGELSAALRARSRAQHGTLFMTLLAAFQAFLGRHTGQEDLAVGSARAGRTSPQAAYTVGYFVNQVVLRADLSGDPGFTGLLERTRAMVLAAFEHGDYPLPLLAEHLQPERDASRTPLFQVSFVLQKETRGVEGLTAFPLGEEGVSVGPEDFRLESMTLPRQPTPFDLVLHAVDRQGGLSLAVQYNTDLFDGATAERFLDRFVRLLAGVAAEPERRLSELPLLSGAERAQLLTEWNDTGHNDAETAPVHELILDQARQRPEALAVAAPGERLTYGELAARAGQLAAFLRRIGVRPEGRVALCAGQTADRVVGSLAILSAGGAHVLLDPESPPERLAFQVTDSAAEVVLAERALAARFPGCGVPVVDIATAGRGEEGRFPAPAAGPDHLAYVVYTSGSTGTPKGVAVSHAGLRNLVSWHRARYGICTTDRATLIASPAFDASVWELWPYLAAGASLHIPDPETRLSPPSIVSFWRSAGITWSFLPTPLAEEVMAEEDLSGLALKGLLCGGDRLHRAPRAGLPFALINHYGPSEASVVSTSETVLPESPGAPPIGRPISGFRAFVADPWGGLMPRGAAGELWLGGAGLARGYFARPALTAERFVPDPWSVVAGGRLYRTGDLVRHRPDGRLEFLGRIDHQIKLRGYRVELGEIEAALRGHRDVSEAAVAFLPREQRLVAYVVAANGEAPSGRELRELLRERLPGYMVPAAYLHLPALPRTPNGKLDRKALPAPGPEAAAGPAGARISPRTPAEELMAEIFAEVLGTGPVGAEDGFFERGGHSLAALRLTARVRETLGVELPVSRVFEIPTVAELAREVEGAARSGAPPLTAVPRGRPLPLSFAQERLWFLHRLDPESPVYNVPAAIHLRGRLDPAVLAAALGEVVRRHETLRTRFSAGVDGPVQVVEPPAPVLLPAVDLAALPAARRPAEARRLARAEALRPFDLGDPEGGPLLRVALIVLDDGEQLLLLTLHHVISDGWSMRVLARELGEIYGAFAGGRPSPLPELEIQYADYAVWQRGWLQGGLLEAGLAHWRSRLAGAPAVLDLPLDRPRTAGAGHRGASRALALSPSLLPGLQDLARRQRVTLFMAALAALQALLSRVSQSEDVSVGTPVAGRGQIRTEGLIGFFVNTLVLRTDLSGEPPFTELLARVREVALDAYAHQDLPFEKLVEELQPQRDLGVSPLVQVLFTLEEETPSLRLGDIEGEIWPLPPETEKLDLSLTLGIEEGRLAGSFSFRTGLFEPATVERLAGGFARLLAGAVEEPRRRLAELPLLAPEERAQLLLEWGSADPMPSLDPDIALHGLFEAQAERTPGAVALVAGEESWTYQRLDREAGALARHLVRLGVAPEARVGVCLRRTPLLAVSLLAVLKAGGAYVPLDPDYPRERLAFLLEDAGAGVLLTQSDLAERCGPFAGAVVEVDQTDRSDRSDRSDDPSVLPGNLAYLIYTSGSTGRPKAVAIEHRSAVAFARWARTVFSPEELAGVLAATSVSFDLSVFELFVTLAWGGTVILAANALELPRLPRAGEVTLVNTVPSAMAELVRQGGLPASVRTVNLAGEPLRRSLVEAIHASLPGCRVLNLYGPSEDTTYSTWAPAPPGETREPLDPDIGAPVAGTRAVVLGHGGELVPPGVAGELCLGGEGLARGYLGRPDLTAERFVPDPFTAEGGVPGGRLYRTGDLARWLPGGSLDYLGRIDQQVKVRGFRIELGEIEAALLAHDAVREAAVLLGEAGLVAYVVAEDGNAPGAAGLRSFLGERLPGFMLPSAWVFLPGLPRSSHGKVDRRALAELRSEPETAAERAGGGPRTPTEELVAGIFSEVLGQEIGRTESFFEAGGHSLLAAQVAARVQHVLGVELPVRTVFEAPTVAALARTIESSVRSAAPPLAPAPRCRELPLSFAQERLWFLHQLDPASPVYNMPAAVRLAGPLDPAALAAALGEVVRRHEALRTRFTAVEGRPGQAIGPPAPVRLPAVDLAGLPADRRPAEARRLAREEALRSFDLGHPEGGLLLRATLIALDGGERLLLLTLHHVVSDGWSMRVLARELGEIYGAFAQGRPSPLPELEIQYADFAVWQRDWLQGGLLEAEITHWRSRLAGAPAVLDLPLDRPRTAEAGHRGASRALALPPALLPALHNLARRQKVTLFMAALAAFQALLSRVSNSEDVSVGTPVAGRGPIRTEGLIGFFVNTLVIRTDLSGDPPFTELLARVREVALDAYAHQDLPFEKLVEELHPQRDLSISPLIQVLFTLEDEPPALRLGEVSGEIWPLPPETEKLDLSLTLAIAEGRLSGYFSFRTHLFEPATVERLAGGFARLLAGAVDDPARRLAELPLLSVEEQEQLLVEWNDTEAPRRSPLVHELIADRARRHPEALAVAAPGERLTYGELLARATRLARLLGRLGVGPEARVAVCAGQTVHRVVGSLAVLLAGGAYVPLDPEAPPERLAFLAADCAAAAVLTERALAGRFSACASPRLLIEEAAGDGDGEGEEAPAPAAGPDNLAYVIYTSGSTGLPKGVAVPHAGLLNLVRWHVERYEVGPADRATLIVNPAFDASVWEIWPYLAAGASLHLPAPEARLAPAEIVRHWRSEAITWSFLPTPLAEEVIEEVIADPAACAGLSLKGLLCGGDRLHRAPAAGLPFPLINHYGPSEVSVVTTCAAVDPDLAGAPPIGRPIRNLRVCVAGSRGELVPCGVAGELWIGGEGLARGYLDRPALTAERFVPDPWSREAGARLYRTGDLVRRLPDGSLDFVGRVDHQIKLRGFRIEPGEIEAALREHPAVSEAAVGAAGQRLVAWVAGGEPSRLSGGELRDFLRARLPAYMVPAVFVPLPALPLTPNGKLDRKALPTPETERADQEILRPRSATEEKVAAVFAEILNVPAVGRNEDFFALGGHSLLAAKAAARLGSAFGIEVTVRMVFETPTVEGLAGWLDVLAGEERLLEPFPRAPRGEPLVLSLAQQRLWFLEKIEPGAAYLHLPAALDGQGHLDAAALAWSLGEILRRHEMLRTRFLHSGGKPLQIPVPAAELAAAPLVPWIDLSALSGSVLDGELARRTAAEAVRPFDLDRGPLLRASLLRLGPESHRLLLTVHHIAADAASVALLIQELGELYAACAEGRPSPLPKLSVQYADYAVWQRRRLSGDRLEEPLRYWRERLAPQPPVLELPTDRPRSPLQSRRGARRPVHLEAAAVDGMRRLGAQAGATLFTSVLAVFQAVLGRHAGQDDVVVGTAVAERPDPALERVVGLFLNTLVLRSDLSGDPAFRTLLARVRETVLGALEHAELPFEQLVESLQTERDLSRSPLFQVFFALRSDPLPELALPGLALRPADAFAGTAQFDLSLHLEESGGGLGGWIEHNPDLFDGTTVERLALHCGILLAGAAADPGRRLSELPLLSAAETAQLVVQWNDTRLEVPGLDACIHDLVQARAERDPDRIAAVDAHGSLTCRELEDRASRLALRLLRLGVRPGDRVGVCVERSVAMLCALLGVLKAGAAYVPLDPDYPQARLAAMLEDSEAAALIVSPGAGASLRHPRILSSEVAAEAVPGGELPELPAEAAAYVLYTSGSTGRPKGVVVSHRNAVRLFAAMDRELGAREPGIWLAVTSICFDISVVELLWTLARGFRVVIHGERSGEEVSVAEQIARHGVSHLQCTPSLAGMLAASPERLWGLAPLSRLILGGEALPGPLAERLAATVTGEVRNLYGPTETTIWSLGQRVESGEERPPIGRPLANTEVYLLDPLLRPVPLGAHGEVFLGGDGVALGYWRRPDLTAERFLPDPLGSRPGGRLYRTGDLARHRRDGRLEFLGRTDHQVKVRGVRIELGEIEAALRAHPAVAQAVAAVREEGPGGRRLIAYVVPAPGVSDGATAPGELRGFLAERLPEAMLPSAFVTLPALPLTQNGKIDRSALPAPDAGRPHLDSSYVPPRTPGEKTLAAIWQDVLGLERIGVQDNFFELGGSSLLLVEIESRLREAFGREIPIVEMFRNPTIRGLAAVLDSQAREPAGAAEPLPVRIVAAAAEGTALDRQRHALEELKRRRAQQKRAGR